MAWVPRPMSGVRSRSTGTALESRATIQRFHSLLLSVLLGAAALSAEPGTVILDNTDGAGVEVAGSWVSAQDVVNFLSDRAESANERERFASQHYGVEYLHDRGTGKGAKSVTFRPRLVQAGDYEVFAWWTAGPDRATRVPLTLGSADGERSLHVNQRDDGGRWQSLGLVRISARDQAWVRIDTAGADDGRVVADAVKFVRRGAGRPFPPESPVTEPVSRPGRAAQLLVDQHHVSATEGVRRVLARPLKANAGRPILVADRPWEDERTFGIWATAVHDESDGLFKMWYWPQRHFHAYATSRDGVNWTKPELGLQEWRGSKANNIFETSRRAESFGRHFLVYLDPHETDPAHRFKGVGDAPRVSRSRLLHSADGLRWQYYHDAQPVTYRAADFTNQILWDPVRRAYLLYTRSDYGDTGGRLEFRGLRTMINPDPKVDPEGWRTLKSWLLDRPGDLPNRRQIYANVTQLHEGVHVGLMLVYEHIGDLSEGAQPDHQRRHERDILNLYLATSRDGAEWDTHWIYEEKPWIERGPDGSFDKDGVLPVSVVTRGDEHFIYYGGWTERHEMHVRSAGGPRAIGLAQLPRDRLAGWGTTGCGTLTTRPFVFEGDRLLVNAAAAEGEVRVEVLDEAGRPLPGFGLAEARSLVRVDGIRLPVAWARAEVSRLRGQVIRLRFHLRNAEVFAFRAD